MIKRVPVSVSVMKKRVSGGKYCRILLLTFVWPPPATNKALSPPSLCLGPFQFTASKQVLLRLLPRFDLFPPPENSSLAHVCSENSLQLLERKVHDNRGVRGENVLPSTENNKSPRFTLSLARKNSSQPSPVMQQSSLMPPRISLSADLKEETRLRRRRRHTHPESPPLLLLLYSGTVGIEGGKEEKGGTLSRRALQLDRRQLTKEAGGRGAEADGQPPNFEAANRPPPPPQKKKHGRRFENLHTFPQPPPGVRFE